ELFRKQQRWAELADIIKAHVERETATATKIDLYLALGDLCETQLASTSRAIEAYQAAADLDDQVDDVLVALERLYKRDERWGKLAHVLEQRAELFEHAGDNQRASAVRRELATLRADKLGDLEGAIVKYERALETDDHDTAALKALEDLYEKSGRTEDYLHTLTRLSEVAPEGDRAAVLRRLGGELEERDGGLPRAIACFERVLELEPSAEDAYRTLERLLAADAQWYELVACLERHIAVIKAPPARVALYLRMAEVYEKNLDDPHRAIEGYLNALSIAEDHHESLVALARLYKRTESWDRAVDILVKHADREHERGAELWFQAAEVASEQLEDHEIAERHYEKALAVAQAAGHDHQGALLGLARLHEKRGNWQSALSCLMRAEEHTPNRLERVGILARAADIAEDHLEDSSRSLELLLKVLKLDPDHEEAGVRTAERLVGAGRWEEALPILEMLARKVSPEDKLERSRREATLGRACEALGLREKAARHYRAAVESDPDGLEASLGLVSILYVEAIEKQDAERWAEVDTRYRELLARHRTGLADRQVVDVWYRVGQAARHLGDPAKATGAFRRALERDPQHAETLEAIIEVATAAKDWRTVVDAKRAQLENAGEAATLRLLEEIGDLTRAELKDPETALGAYLEGLQIRADSHVLLHKSLEIYTEQKQWRRAIETLDTLASQETEVGRRAKYQYAGAVVARDELGDVELAVEHFNLALDDAPQTPKAFDAIDKLLRDKGDYKSLARAYRRMLKRVGEDAPAEQLLELWTRLGNICMDHLGDNEAAIAAYEVATSIDPDNTERHEQLANLYLEAGEARRPDAIEELQVLIQHDADRVELYRALSNLYQEEGDEDKAFCLAQALSFLGAASDGERALYQAHRPAQFVLATRRLTEELWQKSIIHQRENRHLNALFSSLVGSIAATTSQPPQAFNLSPSTETNVDKDPHLVARVFKYSTNILALDPEPHLYLQPDSSDGIRVANTSDKGKLAPSMLVGNPHAGKRDERELAFEVGKRLAYFRPERYVSYALQTLPKLEGAVQAALVAAGVLDDVLPGEAGKLVAHLKKTVPRPVLEQVGVVGEKLKSSVHNGLVAGWRTATDLTANRVGLILCNDLETAARMVATEPGGISTLSAKDRLRDLLSYSVSESYFAVRRHLGITVRDHA
ncbi:MAG TPA: tetratricopeptide repeat protein, partial [Kofleriaceae bacterium]|nr:tetratricopeptide repeat protein [Kofleriaceae bacterium]